jgi:predicted amidohydrolase
MTGRFRVACVQTNSGNEMAANIAAVTRLVRDARERGAGLIALPEVVTMMEPDRTLVYAKAFAETDHPALAAFRALAIETGAWLLAGSLTVRVGPAKVANRSLLLDPKGGIAGRYDKIHMFDVDLPGGETYRESDTYEPGRQTCVAPTPWGGLGMTVCYDVRFPRLYRDLALAGADFLSIPSAFTRPTGAAHWNLLLRARAVENGCFVFAPAQCGEHAGGRKTYGHSLIVDPWGTVLAEAGEDVGIIVADIDPARVAEVRAAVPSLRDGRDYAPPSRLRAAE